MKWWRRMGKGRWREWGRRLWSRVPTSLILPTQSWSRLPTSPISPTQRRSRLPSTNLAYPPRWSRLPNADLSSTFLFFFFLPPLLTDLAWVFLLWLWVDFLGLGCCRFYFCGCGLALRLEFLALISFLFFIFGLVIRGLRLCLVVEKTKENHRFYLFRDKPMNPIWVLS